MAFAFAAAQAVPMIANGGFETGDFSGWTLDGSTETNWVDTGIQHGGDFSAIFGEFGKPASITQTLATEAGRSYTVTFWLSNLGGAVDNTDTASTFEVLAGGASLLSLNDKTATDYAMTQLQFTAVADSTELAFRFQHDENFWLFDDVAVSELSSGSTDVPEPSSMLILALGAGLIGLQRRRS
jgi:hypothetical protein